MFNEIKREEDVQDFLEKTNQLHDGYILSAVYANKGIEKTERGHAFFPWKTTLTLQILVTSIWDTVVEIEFEGLHEWQIRNNFSDILTTTVTFDDEGHVIWADDVWKNIEEPKTCSYVIARSMKWQIVE